MPCADKWLSKPLMTTDSATVQLVRLSLRCLILNLASLKLPPNQETRTILPIFAKTLSKNRRKNSSAVAQGLALNQILIFDELRNTLGQIRLKSYRKNDWGHWNSKATEVSNSSLCMRGQWHPQEICEHLPLTSREIGWNTSPVARFGKGSCPLYQCSAGSPLLQHFASLGQLAA